MGRTTVRSCIKSFCSAWPRVLRLRFLLSSFCQCELSSHFSAILLHDTKEREELHSFLKIRGRVSIADWMRTWRGCAENQYKLRPSQPSSVCNINSCHHGAQPSRSPFSKTRNYLEERRGGRQSLRQGLHTRISHLRRGTGNISRSAI
jgi:hypothetical protein